MGCESLAASLVLGSWSLWSWLLICHLQARTFSCIFLFQHVLVIVFISPRWCMMEALLHLVCVFWSGRCEFTWCCCYVFRDQTVFQVLSCSRRAGWQLQCIALVQGRENEQDSAGAEGRFVWRTWIWVTSHPGVTGASPDWTWENLCLPGTWGRLVTRLDLLSSLPHRKCLRLCPRGAAAVGSAWPSSAEDPEMRSPGVPGEGQDSDLEVFFFL